MLKKLTLLTLALCGVLAAQTAVRPARSAALPRPGLLKRQLNLTDDQVKQFRELRKTQAEQLKPQREQMQAAARNLRSMMAADNPDPAAVGRQMLDLKKMRQSLQQSRQSYVEKAKSILTPEQQQKLEELRNRRPKR